jgi:hypothetical protein
MHDAPIGGAVYVFRVFDGITISQVAKLTFTDGTVNDSFGYSVSVHGNFILVGAPGANPNNSTINVGSAYLFGNPSNDPNIPKWTQLQQIQPNDDNNNELNILSPISSINVIGRPGPRAFPSTVTCVMWEIGCCDV